MKARYTLTLAGIASLMLPLDPSFAHTRGSCGEVGFWDAQVSTTNRATAHTIEADVTVDNIPGSDYCTEDNGAVVYQDGTMHNSLHARTSGACLEIVAQRYSSGDILMWGYDCGGGSANTQWVQGYGANRMRLWMSSGGGTSTTWATWYYRYDTQAWVYLGDVPNRPTYMTPWVESTGYNASLTRRTAFSGYRATNQYGSWSPVFDCPISEPYDSHQTMRVGAAGSVSFEHRAAGAPACISTATKVELYQHTNYVGWKAAFGTGSYTLSQMIAAGAANDDASSIKVPAGYRVTLYADDNFSGTAIVKTASDSSLVDDSFNDRVSSMKIDPN